MTALLLFGVLVPLHLIARHVEITGPDPEGQKRLRRRLHGMALPGRMADAAPGHLEAERLLSLLPAGRAAQHIIELLGRVVVGRVEALRRLDIEPEAQRLRSRKAVRA